MSQNKILIWSDNKNKTTRSWNLHTNTNWNPTKLSIFFNNLKALPTKKGKLIETLSSPSWKILLVLMILCKSNNNSTVLTVTFFFFYIFFYTFFFFLHFFFFWFFLILFRKWWWIYWFQRVYSCLLHQDEWYSWWQNQVDVQLVWRR